MKKIFKIISIVFITMNCTAQTTIINIKDQDGHPIQEAYYKDIDSLLNPFVGTYKCNISPTTFLKITLIKSVEFYNGYYYQDTLLGGYQYVENGVQKVNTLNDVNLLLDDPANYSIDGNGIRRMGSPVCSGCTANEVRIFAGLVEHITNNWAQIIFGKTTVNGQEALKMNVIWQTKTRKETDPPGPHASFPGGNWVLIKQP
jgi:hypothetical protein